MTESCPELNRAVVLEYPGSDVIVIRLVREGRRNTLSEQMVDALDAALIEIAANPPRAVIITGQGKAFCAGAEIAGRCAAIHWP
jgi:2-(1,2-epoxy-1,2-dihydrophenyl)acetyl-CoA isomerase